MKTVHTLESRGAEGMTVSTEPETSRDEVDMVDEAPLSFGQRRLWFLDQMEPASALYHIPHLVRLRGELDGGALEQALRALIGRHESLRTIFRPTVHAEPVQVPRLSWRFHLPRIDLTEMAGRERHEEFARRVEEEARRPFDLGRDLMLRATLFRLGEREHALLLVMHHIASDGWSMAVFLRELGGLYTGFVAEEDPVLPALPIQFADFACWERDQLRGERLRRLIAHWKKQLAGAPPLLELPSDRPRPARPSYRGSVVGGMFPRELLEGLKGYSRRRHVTLFMTLLAAFKVLLHRVTGQTDVVVGSPVAGRDRPELEGLVGFFVNTLVLRTDLAGDPGFDELVARVRETALKAFEHQEVPFEKLVGELQPERNLSHAPICQVMFALQNAPDARLELPGLTLEIEPVYTGTAKFDLTVWGEETKDGLIVNAEFNTDLFEAETIRRFLGHFRTLLESVTSHPAPAISKLPLLTPAERDELLIRWNDTRVDFPRDGRIHALIEEQAARAPDAAALVFEDRRLSYRELDEQAARLAETLRASGVGPGVFVAVCVERSIEMVVGLLAVLKAGGAYLPLDPSHPGERLRFMLEDSQAAVLLTQESLRDNLKFEISNLRSLCLDAMEETPAHSNLKSEISNLKSSDPAYVIYTSGSTGNPKGVVVTHGNVLNFFTGMDGVLGVEPSAAPGTWLAATSISFDISVLELFWTLARGFKVVLLSDEEKVLTGAEPARAGGDQGNDTVHTGLSRPDGVRMEGRSETRAASRGFSLAEQIERHGVTHLQCTPSMARLLTQSPAAMRAIRCLRKLVIGGEAFPGELAGQLRSAIDGELLNLYGPTETTVWSAFRRVEERDVARAVVPLGSPVANTRIYVLDAHLEPVPIGVPGEIYIGGEGVASGYLNRPGLTRERFLANPFQPGERMYRTGDAGRFRQDGSLEFLGRLDQQVKVRGHRIELGEIESVLGRHSAVRQCAVVAREESSGGNRLVAYVAGKGGAPSSEELRGYLRSRLPEYMVPPVFVALEQLPLTPNGKVDRKSLPRAGVESGAAGPAVGPRNAVEERLAGIWREVLGVGRVGVHDNFFDLGGHSLLVAQAIARVRQAFGVDLPVRSLFEAPTVAGQAGQIAARRQEGGGPDAGMIPRRKRPGRSGGGNAELNPSPSATGKKPPGMASASSREAS